MLTAEGKKRFRAIGHNLKPIVTIGGKGLSDNVIAELDRALHDHELIKVKVAIGERDERAEAMQEVCETLKAELVQSIGKMALLYRAADKPNPKLSNLLR